MRIVTYQRVSNGDQAESGLSLDYQAEKTRALAALQDWEVVESVQDAGISAKNLDRPGLQRILAMVRARKIDGVIVLKLDRLTRSMRDLLDLLDTFKRYGVRLVSVQEQLDTESATGKFFLGMMGLIAEWERETISERTSAALSQLKRDGKRFSGHPPYGFDFDTEGNLVEVESEQTVLRIVEDLAAKKLSLRKIGAALEADGHRPRSGGSWSPSVLARIRKAA